MSEQTDTVWVVDDNAAVASSLVLLLKTCGVKAEERTNAQMVLADLANGIRPAAMVLDLMMPHNGASVLDAILARPDWDFPVVVQTGKAEAVPERAGGRVLAVLRKPCDPVELLAVLKRAVPASAKGGVTTLPDAAG